MHRVNLGWFCDLGAALRPLASTQAWGEPNEALASLYRLRQMLGLLVDSANPIQIALRSSRPIIWALNVELDQVFEDAEKAHERYENRRMLIYGFIAKLDVVVNSELGVQPTYQVAPKRAYDTDILVENATSIFSSDVRAELSDVERYDIEQAGRCLAFEIPTAAAFHIFRAMESSIREYYGLIVGSLPKVKMRNWGTYIKNLNACGGDPKILGMLTQIKELYRNRIIHPEHKIESEEALSLVGMAESIIAAIKKDIKIRSLPKAASLHVVSSGESP